MFSVVDKHSVILTSVPKSKWQNPGYVPSLEGVHWATGLIFQPRKMDFSVLFACSPMVFCLS